jgi:hypothetical protein
MKSSTKHSFSSVAPTIATTAFFVLFFCCAFAAYGLGITKPLMVTQYGLLDHGEFIVDHHQIWYLSSLLVDPDASNGGISPSNSAAFFFGWPQGNVAYLKLAL